ncbi:PadR family transcriptional regulator [Corynebacterium sp.]|uniref:PadR family transcriptional regulator n=1 Tax=Corynebacterium sp. TaxID=1720 RepID=UPI0026DB87C1|nr:PadR family transcriptional regulator [Corynebacterium sp.]MDO5032682.1 PadR family transcriptional regulator [Corynebacterium sp.]
MPIKHSVLALLSEQPATASHIQQRFAEAMGGVWPLNIGQVAQTLSRLERDELITTAGEVTGPTGRRATSYAISPAGAEELRRWWTSATEKATIERDELVLKVTLAAQRSDVDVIAVLDTQRFATLRQLRELNQQASQLPETRCAQRLAVERQIFELESLSRWLDRAESLSQPTSSESEPTS